MPNSKRPWLSWSTVAASSAMRSGWLSGRTCTAVPTWIRFVRAAMAVATALGDEMTERAGLKWISPSHTQSNPQDSIASTVSKLSRKASTSVRPGRASSMKTPKCMGAKSSAAARGFQDAFWEACRVLLSRRFRFHDVSLRDGEATMGLFRLYTDLDGKSHVEPIALAKTPD